jgi:transposase
MREQAANTSRNRRITIGGETMIVMDAARRFRVSQYTIYNRLNRGLSDHQAVFGTGRSRYVTINGERMIVSEAEKRFKVSRGTIYSRLDRGLSDHEAVFGAQK